MKRKVNKKANIQRLRQLKQLYYRLVLALKLFMVMLIFAGLFSSYFSHVRENIKQYFYDLTRDYGFKLEHVLIEGQKNISHEDIFLALNVDTGIPIFSIKPIEIKRQLEKNPWVKTAIVERRLPQTIYIGIIERLPIAIWQNEQKLFLIDDEGSKITDKELEKFHGLLHIVGSDANVYAQKLIADLAIYPRLSNKVLSAVRYGGRRWNLNLQQNINIKMPEDDFNSALRYLNELYETDKLFNQGYKSLDLRINTKYFFEKF